MTPDDRRRESARMLGLDRLNIFVPAVMSVGLVFWMVSELVEVFRARAEEVREARARVAGAEVVDDLLDRRTTLSPSERGLRPRPVYVMVGLTLCGTAVYVVVGSLANYLRPGGYVSNIAWLLALATAVALVATTFGVIALLVAVRWPVPTPWIRGLLLRTPLGTAPADPDQVEHRPSWRLSASIVAVAAAAATITLIVGWSPHVVDDIDDRAAGWIADGDVLSSLAFLDPLGSTGIALALALLAGLASIRCRVLASGLAMAMVAGLVLNAALRPLVARPRPATGEFAGQIDSYPSGHVLLSVVLAGLLPMALAVLTDRTRIIRPLQIVFGIGVIAGALHRVAVGLHWPTDVIGAGLMGLALVLAVQWVVDTGSSHHSCHHCPWSGDRTHAPILGALPIHPTAHGVLRITAHLSAAMAATGLAVLAFSVELPVDSEGFTAGREVQYAAQIFLAVLVSVGALIAWRWEGAAAVLIAFAAAGAGVYASVTYPPAVGLLFTGALMIPAVLLWLSWQHRRRSHEVVWMAVGTAVLLATTWGGATAVYDHFFGPTHPESTTITEVADRVDWVWAGGLDTDRVTVTARLRDDADTARLHIESVSATTMTDPVAPDEYGIVRLDARGLDPGTAYTYRVVVDGEPDDGRGHGTFETPVVGPMSFTVTAAACARTGSNGAVFDAIRSESPLMHLITGDLHYENIESTSPKRYIEAYGRALTTPAQAALARSVPMAYVWDDHDYGANDADASSSGRSAVREAYRRAVPDAGVAPGDRPINHAFTIGRVRFVLTDTRSEKTDETMLGAEQLDWLLDELMTASTTHAVVIWVSSVPWIGESSPGADAWYGYPDERTRIADEIAEAGITNLLMLAGDAHMVAIDDGSNSDYSTSGGAGFPVLHAAALDRPGSTKGGPYSEGAFPGSGQFGRIDVEDHGGDTVTVRLTGLDYEGDTIVEYEYTVSVT